MTTGVLTTGYEPKPYSEIVADLKAAVRSMLGSDWDVSDDSVTGRLIAVIADATARVFELQEQLVLQFKPESAEGAFLDAILDYSGIQRLGATRSKGFAVVTGDTGTEIAAGALSLQTPNTAAYFETTEDITLLAIAARAASTAYVLEDLVSNGDSIFVCTAAGTSSSAVGLGPLDPSSSPSETDAISDGTLEWRFVGDGDAAAWSEIQSTEAAAVAVGAFTLEIATPVSAVLGAVNPYDTTAGKAIESDESARLRRQLLVYSGAVPSSGNQLRRALLGLQDVTEVRVFTNTTSVEADGVPAHGVECVVLGGDAQQIASTIYETLAAGTAMAGNTTYSVVDANGHTQEIKLSRPEDRNIYVALELKCVAGEYAGDADVIAKVTALQLRTGRDVVSSQLAARALQAAGVVDCVAKIGTSASPTTTTTVAISLRQIARLDSTRITVTVEYVEP